MERIISTKNCDPTTRSCSLLEQHLDFITAGRRCFEKMLEPVCATIDCEFKARDEEDCASMVRPINVRMYDLVLGFKDCNFSGFVVRFFEGKIRFTNVVLKHFYKTWFGVWAPFGILGSKFVGSDNLGSTLPY